MPRWTAAEMPAQHGKTILITGGNSGLGYESARALAANGARVVIASRNTAKAEQARADILQETPGAQIDIAALDLADLGNVRAFAQGFMAEHDALHGLLNNAGVMALPYRQSPDGHEMQLAVNHLGHFALTGHLLPVLLATPASRVVTVSSVQHFWGRIFFDNLHGERGYERWTRYAQSKLANVLFAKELDRRLRAARAEVKSMVAHPGYAATNLQHVTAQSSGNPLDKLFTSFGNQVIAQSAEMGALPQLYALTMPDVDGGEFWGPALVHVRGYPKRIKGSPAGRDPETARRLWEESIRLTGVTYDALETVPAG